MDSALDSRRMVRGLRIFAGVTVVSFVALCLFTADRNTWTHLTHLRAGPLLLALALVFLSWSATAVKVRILVSGLGGRVGFWGCLRAHLSNMFLSAVTPFQTGGGAAQIYVLWRLGVPVSLGTAASLAGALITILTLFAAGVSVLALRPGFLESVALRMVAALVTGIFGLALFLFWVAFFRPAWSSAVVRRTAALVARLPLVPDDRVWALHDSFSRELADLIEYLRSYLKRNRRVFLTALGPGLVSIFANCLVAYALLLGMGIQRDPVEVFLAQALLYFVVYFSPSPGGSGVAEAGGASIMAAMVPMDRVAILVVLWRFLTYLLGVAVGGLVLLGFLRSHGGAAGRVPRPAAEGVLCLEPVGVSAGAEEPSPGGGRG